MASDYWDEGGIATSAYPWWVVSAARRSYTDPMETGKWAVFRVQAEHKYLAQAMVERDLPAYMYVISVAKEVLVNDHH